MQTVFNILKVLVGIYLLVLFLMYFFQDRLIFFAQPINNPYISQFSEYEITFNHEGVTLHGWFVNRGVSVMSPLIIYYGGNAEEVSGNLLDLDRFPPASFLFLNYRRYGKSEGKPTEKNLVKDALFVIDEMVSKHEMDPSHIVLLGRSLGSGVAVQVAAQRQIRAVILVTPFDSLVNVAKSHYPIFPINYLVKHRFDSLKYAGDIQFPALALLGTEDRVIPNHHSLALIKAWSGPMESLSIEGADHNNIQLFPEYWSAISDFLK
jgi:uncharacterized protein